MLRVFNATARYVDQGGNKRPGAFAIYLEPWHSDIFDFLDLKKNTGKEEQVGNLMVFLIKICLLTAVCAFDRGAENIFFSMSGKIYW